MKRLVDTTKISHEEWLNYRKMGITGTDAGSICGLNPYKSAMQVFIDKTLDVTESSDNEAMRQGRDLEEYVARRFCEATGKKVRRINAICISEEHPFMLADFDRLIVGERAGLECKTVSAYSSDKWANGKIPLHYQLQVQHYLAVSGFDAWYIAALILGSKFIIHKIERDEELIENLITIEKRFWEQNVLAGVMPDPDGSDDCSKMIAEMYFKSDREKTIQLLGCNELLYRRQELDELIKKLDKEKSEIEQKIKMEMQDAAYATTDDFRVSWTSFDQTRLDSKKLKEEQPEIYEKYSKTSSSRRFSVTRAA